MLIPIISYPKIDSTNEEVKRVLATSDRKAPFAIVAHEQTAGRGTSGRKWESKAGENITISYCFAFHEIVQTNFPLSIGVAFAVTEFLMLFDIKAKIKYPNDVYVESKKIGGILIETGFWGRNERQVIIGIGLNVNQKDFSLENNSATSMNLTTNRNYILVDMIPLLSEKLERYLLHQSPNNSAEINDRFLWKDECVQCCDISGTPVVEGVFKGLADDETICLETEVGLKYLPVAAIKSMNYVD